VSVCSVFVARLLTLACMSSILGAIYSCLSAFATMFPNARFLMFFIVPMPAWAAVGGIFAVSTVGIEFAQQD
jgi:membrane associated rhomboid family serine protease